MATPAYQTTNSAYQGQGQLVYQETDGLGGGGPVWIRLKGRRWYKSYTSA